MKYLLILFTVFTVSNIYAKNKHNILYKYNTGFVENSIPTKELAREFYDMLLVSKRIISFTNKFIDTKVATNPSVPSSTWQQIKNEVDYSSFIDNAIVIIQNNYTTEQLNTLINHYKDLPYAQVVSPKAKKELLDASLNFGRNFSRNFSTVLRNHGF